MSNLPPELTGVKFYSITTVAKIFEVTPATIRNWITSGSLKAVKIQGRWRIPHSAIVAFSDELLDI